MMHLVEHLLKQQHVRRHRQHLLEYGLHVLRGGRVVLAQVVHVHRDKAQQTSSCRRDTRCIGEFEIATGVRFQHIMLTKSSSAELLAPGTVTRSLHNMYLALESKLLHGA